MYEISKKISNAHDDGIWKVKWSGDIIVTGGMSSKVKTWHASPALFLTERKPFDKHILGVSSLDINVSSKYLVTGGMDGHIRIWDLHENILHKDIDSGPLGCWGVAFTANGEQIVSVSESGLISIWSVSSGEKIKSFQNPVKSVLSFALSPNGEHIACASTDGTVSISELETTKKVNSFSAHSTPIRAICYSPNSQYIFTGADDAQIRMHDPQSSKPYIASFLGGHSTFILSVQVSNDGKKLASSGSTDRKVCIWDIESRKLDYTFNGHADQTWDLSWSPDSNKLNWKLEGHQPLRWNDFRKYLLIFLMAVPSISMGLLLYYSYDVWIAVIVFHMTIIVGSFSYMLHYYFYMKRNQISMNNSDKYDINFDNNTNIKKNKESNIDTLGGVDATTSTINTGNSKVEKVEILVVTEENDDDIIIKEKVPLLTPSLTGYDLEGEGELVLLPWYSILLESLRGWNQLFISVVFFIVGVAFGILAYFFLAGFIPNFDQPSR
eukprot:gene5276-6569_t